MRIQFNIYDPGTCSLRGGKSVILRFEDLILTVGLGSLAFNVGGQRIELENVYVYDFARDFAGAAAAICLGAPSSAANVVDALCDIYINRVNGGVGCELLNQDARFFEQMPIDNLARIAGDLFIEVCDSLINQYEVRSVSMINEIRRCSFILNT